MTQSVSVEGSDAAGRIRAILSDVDGVLTDGAVVLDNEGVETKRFHIRDGMGVQLWRRAGGRFGLVTARTSQIVRLRAAEMGAEVVRQGVEDKLSAVRGILDGWGLSFAELCYVGDDLNDAPAVRAAGLGVAVGDACAELRRVADWVTATPGGRGAIREVVERLLKAQRAWEGVIRAYLG